MLEQIQKQSHDALMELLNNTKLKPGEVLVVGCSTSEVAGQKIGTHSSTEIADAIFKGIYPELKARGIYLAAQCCEHLNRAIILERQAAERYGWEEVNVVPQPKAGGSFASAVYAGFEQPTAVEEIRAHAGMDIGDTLIGMHLKRVAVPLRLSVKTIGEARLVCARTRPKFIGGSRAMYDETRL